MGTCRCGSKTVKFTPAKIKKAPIKQGSLAAGGKPEDVSARSRRLSAKATRIAKANAVPCNCQP